LQRLPKCTECGEPIQQEDAVCINGEYYCDHCLKDLRVSVGDD
jgi:formylmethanofuran dehydrogenase subunit E